METAGAGGAHVIGIDVGGSSVKGSLVDVAGGALVGELVRRPSPPGFEPDAVLGLIAEVADALGPATPVGVGFPAVVRAGVLATNPTSHEHPGWKGLAIEDELHARLGRPVAVGNDADVAGEAELRHGAARDARGTVLVLTLGTGIGTAVYRDGVLVPNVELGRLYLAGQDRVAEDYCAARVIVEQGLGMGEWAERLNRYIAHVERLLAPDLVVIGGAVSADSERFMPLLRARAELVPAAFGNDAGPIGAAMVAASR